MHLDVRDLRNFYYRNALGRAAQKIIRDEVRATWPDTHGHTVVGYGFAAPLLRPFLGDSRRVVALMPGPQGVIPWPAGLPNVSVLCDETQWPLETGHVDRLVVMHGLETSEDASALLDECYRVLGPGGEALFIVPNRTGLWARSDRTPFGYGRPYSASQLENLLSWHDFLPEDHISLLYQPPSTRRFWMKTGPFWERIGRAVPAIMAGGVMVVRAKKRYPPRPRGVGERAPSPMGALAPKPVAKPA
ncbi:MULTISPECIES: methyltransferase domain-containing protein [unclassified Roseivivax]|uniref:methyltransferase domain-containing protein n=1 Tax=Roseivivax sp. GX 12232 TaxID=2900547 RepID=UPI001E2D1FB9|nr:class I SAM-dependent methyltransferase [Roseivivax sp. GX 12232]MCE0505651.1 class I SAM-dependent methyltransferase [Roseivivax sp. GX 12232]